MPPTTNAVSAEVVDNETLELIEEDKEEQKEQLEDEQYKEALIYRLTRQIPDTELISKGRRRMIRRLANRLVLICSEGQNKPKLAYRELTGKLTKCLHKDEVQEALNAYYNIAGHFSEAITRHKVITRFYQPDRSFDIHEYCRSCTNCQFITHAKPSKAYTPVIHLQPMDVIGMDYIGPITPQGTNSERYILIGIDYMTRRLQARATKTATSADSTDFYLQEIVRNHGHAGIVYTDNGSHFTGGIFPQVLEAKGVKQVRAPTSHLQSVGLAERYVQLVLKGLRVVLQGQQDGIHEWNRYLDLVVQQINTRWIRLGGFTPFELMYGANPRFNITDIGVKDMLRLAKVKREMRQRPKIAHQGQKIADIVYADHANRLNELRTRNLHSRILLQEKKMDKDTTRFEAPEEGDLVLLHRVILDLEKGHKLKPRYEGPYLLESLEQHGKSGQLTDIHLNLTVGKYHLNDLKRFVVRQKHVEDGEQ